MAQAIAPIPCRHAAGAYETALANVAEPTPAAPPDSRPFLTADWRDLVMLTYEADPRVLAPYVPRGTELDFWQGGAYISVVGFTFARARLFGIRIPLHQNFAEVNLRFYVRRRIGSAWRRGVVFLRELVAKRTVALVARVFYGEQFLRVPMSRRIERSDPFAAPQHVDYRWRFRGRDHRIAAQPIGPPEPPAPGSLADFVVEHYWAYTSTRRGDKTIEYLVTHPAWQTAPAADAALDCDTHAQYGDALGECLTGTPTSAFWADGSAVCIYPGRHLKR